MFTTEGSARPRTSAEPPFLQEPTYHVHPAPEQGFGDRFRELLDRQRPTLALILVAVFIGLGGILFLLRPASNDGSDPLSLSAGPTAAPVAQSEQSGGASRGQPNDPTPASVGPAVIPGRRTPTTSEAGDASTTSIGTSIPGGSVATTVGASTSVTTTATTSTSIATTTSAAPTTSPVVNLANCEVKLRKNADVYEAPSADTERIGRGRGTIRATTFAELNGEQWYQIESNRASGWVNASDVRSTEGTCR